MPNRFTTARPDFALWSIALLGLNLTGTSLAASSSPDVPSAPLSPPSPQSPPRPKMGLSVPLTKPKPNATAGKAAVPPVSHHYAGLNEKARTFYSSVWGVDKLRASNTSSGNLIRFSYRVLQPKLAAPLGDHANTPEMVGIRSNAVLHIPTMEKLGQLRQMSAAESGKEYWMVFSNKGN
jgi:hypothetical protein